MKALNQMKMHQILSFLGGHKMWIWINLLSCRGFPVFLLQLKLEIEKDCVNGRLKAITAHFGDISLPTGI
jgi:hypothetical protein